MGSDISFSAAEIALIVALLGAVTTPLGILFWRYDASLKAQVTQAEKNADDKVKRERELTDQMLPAVRENTETLKRWMEIQQMVLEQTRRQEQEYRELPQQRRIRSTGQGNDG